MANETNFLSRRSWMRMTSLSLSGHRSLFALSSPHAVVCPRSSSPSHRAPFARQPPRGRRPQPSLLGDSGSAAARDSVSTAKPGRHRPNRAPGRYGMTKSEAVTAPTKTPGRLIEASNVTRAHSRDRGRGVSDLMARPRAPACSQARCRWQNVLSPTVVRLPMSRTTSHVQTAMIIRDNMGIGSDRGFSTKPPVNDLEDHKCKRTDDRDEHGSS